MKLTKMYESVDKLDYDPEYPMSKSVQRNIAMSAARQQLILSGFSEDDLIYNVLSYDALKAIDDLSIIRPNCLAC